MRPVRLLPLFAILAVAAPAAGAPGGRPVTDDTPSRATAAAAPDVEPLAVLRLEPYRRSVGIRVATGDGSTGLMAFDTAAGHTVVSPEFAAAGGCKPWGNLGGFTGPYLMGWLQDLTGDFLSGLRVLAVAAVVSAALIVTSRAGRSGS